MSSTSYIPEEQPFVLGSQVRVCIPESTVVKELVDLDGSVGTVVDRWTAMSKGPGWCYPEYVYVVDFLFDVDRRVTIRGAHLRAVRRR